MFFYYSHHFLSMIATAAIVHIIRNYTKLKAFVTDIMFQPITQTEAIFGIGKEQHNCIVQWYTKAALTLMIIGLIIFYFGNYTEML